MLSITIVELIGCWFGVTDGWFDDPIGLSARAYILVPPIALGKFLLAWPHLNPLDQTSPRSPSLRVVNPLAITQHYQATLSRPTPAHQCPPRSMLTRRPPIGRLNHGVVFLPVLIHL